MFWTWRKCSACCERRSDETGEGPATDKNGSGAGFDLRLAATRAHWCLPLASEMQRIHEFMYDQELLGSVQSNF